MDDVQRYADLKHYLAVSMFNNVNGAMELDDCFRVAGEQIAFISSFHPHLIGLAGSKPQPAMQECPTCYGDGGWSTLHNLGYEQCHKCGGTGAIATSEVEL